MASSTRNRTPRLAVLGQSVRRPASSPLTSRSGSALRRRIVVVSLAVLSLALITVSFRESDAGPVHGVQNAGATVLRPFEVATDRVARPFRDAYGWFHGLLNARSENDRLRKENAQLRQQYVAARSAVTRVLSNVAQVTLLSDPTSAVPAKDLSSEASGVIRHSAGGGSALFFDRVPKNQVVRVNDVIVTAGTQLGALPDIYPSGIQIGWVSSSGQSDTEPFKTIQVEPFADLSSLDAVAVLIPKGRRR